MEPGDRCWVIVTSACGDLMPEGLVFLWKGAQLETFTYKLGGTDHFIRTSSDEWPDEVCTEIARLTLQGGTLGDAD
jgi:hypothetical protein